MDQLALLLAYAQTAAFEVAAELVSQLRPLRDVQFFLLGERYLLVLRDTLNQPEVCLSAVLQSFDFVGLELGNEQPVLSDFAPVGRGAD